jgi:hypothetical protein
MHFMFAPIKALITYDYPNANNHLLNTLSMRFLSLFLPLKDHWLRLPNVLAYLLYLVFSWKILSGFSNTYWRIGAWVLLNSVPYMLEFFSLARGYGLSLGFMMASLYFLKEFLEQKKHWKLVWCLAMGALAVLSNIVLLNYYLALCAVLFLNAILARQSKWHNVRSLEIFFAISLPLLAYTIYVAFRMRAAEELFFGTKFGFWDGTIRSIITRVLYKETIEEGQKYYIYGLPYTLGSVFIILVLAASLFLAIKKWRPKPLSVSFFHAVFIIMLLCAASVILQFYVLATPMVLDRTALFFIPLFLLLLIGLFQILWTYSAARILFGIIILFSLVNFSLHANLSYCLEWKYDASTETMMKDLREYDKTKKHSETRRLYTHWTYHPSAAFYQATDDYTFLRPINRYYRVEMTFNYFYIPDNELWRLEGKPVKIIKKYPLTRSTLLENLKPEKKLVYAGGRLSFNPGDSVQESVAYTPARINQGRQSVEVAGQGFSRSIFIPVSHLPQNLPLQIEIEAELFSHVKPMGNLVAAVVTPTDSQYYWFSRELNQVSIAPDRWTRVSCNLALPYFLSEKDKIKVHLWNTGEEPIYLSRMEAIVVDNVK